MTDAERQLLLALSEAVVASTNWKVEREHLSELAAQVRKEQKPK